MFKFCLDFEEEVLTKIYKALDEIGNSIWACTDCDHSSKNKHHVLEHIEAKHVVSAGYHCIACDKMCPTKNALRKHNFRYHK